MNFILSGCASGPVKQRAGVLEAKSCMARMNQSIKNYNDYVIRSCTNTGVWLVDKQDLSTGQLMVTYDFVNHEYSAPQMGPDPVSMDNMADRERQEFLSLQKKLNKALLDEGKS